MSLGACTKSMIRKSLPQAVALTKGMPAISVALGNCILGQGHNNGKVLDSLRQSLLLRPVCLEGELHVAMAIRRLSHVNGLHGQSGEIEDLVEFGHNRIGGVTGCADHVVDNGDRL